MDVTSEHTGSEVKVQTNRNL